MTTEVSIHGVTSVNVETRPEGDTHRWITLKVRGRNSDDELEVTLFFDDIADKARILRDLACPREA